MTNEREEVKYILDTFKKISGSYIKIEDEEETGLFYFKFNDIEYGEFTILIHFSYLNMEETQIIIKTAVHGSIYKGTIQEFEKILTKEGLDIIYHNILSLNLALQNKMINLL